jgi:hypothetical protein
MLDAHAWYYSVLHIYAFHASNPTNMRGKNIKNDICFTCTFLWQCNTTTIFLEARHTCRKFLSKVCSCSPRLPRGTHAENCVQHHQTCLICSCQNQAETHEKYSLILMDKLRWPWTHGQFVSCPITSIQIPIYMSFVHTYRQEKYFNPNRITRQWKSDCRLEMITRMEITKILRQSLQQQG